MAYPCPKAQRGCSVLERLNLNKFSNSCSDLLFLEALSFLFVSQSTGKRKASKSREMPTILRRTILKLSTSTPRPSVRTLKSVLRFVVHLSAYLSVGIFCIGLFLHTSESHTALTLDSIFTHEHTVSLVSICFP